MSKDVNSPKYLSKQLKLAGLQKLKFYCQICEKQCRDANGFKSHIRSQPHILKIQSLSHKDIEDYSNSFQTQFLNTLKTTHKNYINANRFYNELISDRDHIHLNSTKWSSLSQFIRDMNGLGLIGIRKGDEDEEDESLNNLDIIAIGNGEQLNKQDDDEGKETVDLAAKLIERQIKRDKEISKGKKDEEIMDEVESQEQEKKPVKFEINKKALSKPTKLSNSFKVSKPNPLKSNPLKSNPLKLVKK